MSQLEALTVKDEIFTSISELINSSTESKIIYRCLDLIEIEIKKQKAIILDEQSLLDREKVVATSFELPTFHIVFTKDEFWEEASEFNQAIELAKKFELDDISYSSRILAFSNQSDLDEFVKLITPLNFEWEIEKQNV